MLKILVAILTISLVLLYASLGMTEIKDRSFFVDKSNRVVNFFQEAGDRFWEFEWIQGSESSQA